ncbi:hypothetical protein [Citrobacter portucalensis]|mgnify:CR=1 FL=1|uniref:hypothetical protein n=1 Tax=Citrobacter portucalensis TaxID=1639133 RepID=UPI0027D16E6F|nr:hypothetical protein [Citrobacter portucalensis]
MLINKRSIEIVILFLCAALILYLSYLYFRIDADGVNGPVVWLEFKEHGFKSLFDWYPTPDNWYFTLYPVYFLFYLVSGNYGAEMLIFGSAFFAFSVILLGFIISRKLNKYSSLLICVIPLAVLPHIYWTHGFVQHPFAHYSTVAFGMLTCLMAMNAHKNQGLLSYTIVGIFGLLVCSSDMWAAPTYLLPILITEFVYLIRKETKLANFIVLAIFYGIALNHTIPKLLGINSQPFNIVDFDTMYGNAHQLILTVGEMFNIFLFRSNFLYILSFIIVGILFSYICTKGILKKENSSYFYMLSLLSVAGIISAYIISNPDPSQPIPRFFVNIAPFVFIAYSIAHGKITKWLTLIICILFMLSSMTTYNFKIKTYEDSEKEIKDYSSFLLDNNLRYGYGDYWNKSLTTFWVSNGEVIIAPVDISEDGTINFNSPRYQTMRSWYDKEKRLSNGNVNYFIAIDGHEKCGDTQSCINAISSKNGKPDKVLNKGDMTILVYNK